MINYDLKKIKALVFDVDGVLSKGMVRVDAEGNLVRTTHTKDAYALRLASMLGLRVAIITGAYEERIRHRYEALGVSDVFLSSSVKTECMQTLLDKYGLKPDEVLYMGDDIPDYEVMKKCVACCPSDAANEIKLISTYISPRNGGEGCGRDILEQVLKSKGLWMHNAVAFGW